MQIQFTKMQALGNDFIVIDGVNQNVKLTSEQVKFLSDRRVGIGCDQILILEKPQQKNTDFFYRIYNADGSEVAQCGNGARCLAYFIRENFLPQKDKYIISTNNSLMSLQYENDNKFTVEMGVPEYSPAKIPLNTTQQSVAYTLSLPEDDVAFMALSIGNPHAVIIVPDVDSAEVQKIGSALATHQFFPESVNVEFMQIIDENTIALRVYERGVGETLACGSGACAAVVAGRNMNLLADNVQVKMPGGILNVAWEGDINPVFLTGPAVKVFKSSVEI